MIRIMKMSALVRACPRMSADNLDGRNVRDCPWTLAVMCGQSRSFWMFGMFEMTAKKHHLRARVRNETRRKSTTPACAPYGARIMRTRYCVRSSACQQVMNRLSTKTSLFSQKQAKIIQIKVIFQ